MRCCRFSETKHHGLVRVDAFPSPNTPCQTNLPGSCCEVGRGGVPAGVAVSCRGTLGVAIASGFEQKHIYLAFSPSASSAPRRIGDRDTPGVVERGCRRGGRVAAGGVQPASNCRFHGVVLLAAARFHLFSKCRCSRHRRRHEQCENLEEAFSRFSGVRATAAKFLCSCSQFSYPKRTVSVAAILSDPCRCSSPPTFSCANPR